MEKRRDILEPSPDLDNILEEIHLLKTAHKLLTEIYFDQNTIMCDEIRWKVQDFFGYDDSE